MDKSLPYQAASTHPYDRRMSVRYLIRGVVWFQSLTANGEWKDAAGITRDIGTSGLFVESELVPPVSSALKLTASLPAGWGKDITVRLGGSGFVRHVRHGPSEPSGFGASAVFHVEVPISKA